MVDFYEDKGIIHTSLLQKSPQRWHKCRLVEPLPKSLATVPTKLQAARLGKHLRCAAGWSGSGGQDGHGLTAELVPGQEHR